jgi:hypothetical protein
MAAEHAPGRMTYDRDADQWEIFCICGEACAGNWDLSETFTATGSPEAIAKMKADLFRPRKETAE